MAQLAERKGFKIESTLPQKKKAKEKKLKPKVIEHVRIIDDDALIPLTTTTEPIVKADEEIVSYEDAPVVGIVDERPSAIREKERFKDAKRWRAAPFEEIPEPSSIGPHPKPIKSSSSSSSASRRKQNSSDDSDPEIDRRRSRGNEDPDLSPPRRRTQHNDDDDPSPPRRRRQQADDDPSPPRRKHDDSSPPRKRNTKADDLSPPRAHDTSPPRRKTKRDDDPSPPRRRDTSPPRKRQTKDNDHSPPRRRDRSSPSRRKHDRYSRQESSPSSTHRRQPKNEPVSPSASRRLKQESSSPPPPPSQPAKSERRRLAEHKEKVAERYTQWGRGLAQVQQTENAVKDYLEQAEKPLARYRDDKDLDALLKEREREDDPMLKYLSNKTSDTGGRTTDGNRAPPKPRYRGPEPQKNRFDIWPGYRWDGVDRSNGYEKKLFESIANRHAKAQEAYLWSVEDM